MRIALVNTRYLQRGGEEVAFAAEFRMLSSRGHEVETYEVSNEELVELSAAHRAGATVWNDARRKDLRARLHAFKPDVVHFHNTFPLLSPAVYYAVPGDALLVQTLHNYRLICPGSQLLRAGQVCEECVGRFPWAGLRHGCYRNDRAATAAVVTMVTLHRAVGTWRRVDAFIALTAFARGLFERGGLPASRLWVKPNFVDPDPGVGPHDGGFFLFVGRLDEQKGVRVLLDGWRMLDPMPELHIVGDGILRDEVAAFAAAHPAVRVLGQQPRDVVLSEMKRARALVLPSISYENFPFTLAEAFATGLPVVASNGGNLAELVTDEHTGWLFETGSAAALASAIRRAEETRNLREMSAVARATYLASYTADVNYEQLSAIYRQAATRKSAA